MTTYKDNRSFVLRGIDDVVYEERPIPHVGEHEVLIEVMKTGICGSDIHYLAHGRIGDYVVEKPIVLGHESAGIVFQVGSGVTHLRPGTRVAIEPGATCRVCEACKTGKYELCPRVIFAATPPYDGTLSRYYRIPADLAYALPDHLSFEDGAMMEPLAVGVHSVYTLAQVRPNQVVAVFGAGPVGLLAMAVARACGARRVIAIDVTESRLEFAKSYAATDVFCPPKLHEGESRIAYSKRSSGTLKKELDVADTGANGVDVIIEASGAEVCIQTGYYLIKPGGVIVQVGMGALDVQVPLHLLLSKQLVVKGSFRYGSGDYPLAISFVANGKIDLKPLVSHRFAFDDAVKAFEVTRKGHSEDGKGVIKAIIDGPL